MFRELLVKEFGPYGSLSDTQLQQLEQHYQLLIRWNQKINLTRINSLEDAVRFHYCESLYLGKIIPEGPMRIADIGSGSGFPGIPLAILRPECTFELIEAHQRKAVFLTEATRGLPNLTIVAARAESYRSDFDWMTARAVRPQDVLELRLAPQAAILMSHADLAGLDGLVSENALPWGDNRVVALFHVKHAKI